MKNIKGPVWIALVLAGLFALVVSCRKIPNDTTDPDWQYAHRYKSMNSLMGKMQRHWRPLRKAGNDLDYMAKHAEDLVWDAEVIAALAPQIKDLAGEPRVSNVNYLAYARSVEENAAQARMALQAGNWRRVSFLIDEMDNLGCRSCHADYRDK
ncbi:MAG: hypothetical protein ABIH04_05940 [Planctomycetota bacterium]